MRPNADRVKSVKIDSERAEAALGTGKSAAVLSFETERCSASIIVVEGMTADQLADNLEGIAKAVRRSVRRTSPQEGAEHA